MPPENGKGTPKECVSTSATSNLHTYFLRRSAIKFFLTKKLQLHIGRGGTRNAGSGMPGAGPCQDAPSLFVGSCGANGGRSDNKPVASFSSRRQYGRLRCRPSEVGQGAWGREAVTERGAGIGTLLGALSSSPVFAVSRSERPGAGASLPAMAGTGRYGDAGHKTRNARRRTPSGRAALI